MALGNLSAVLIIISSMLGYGISGLPCAFAHIGWIGGIILLTISSIFSCFSIYLMFLACSNASKNKEKGSKITFFELFETLSPFLGDLCNIILVIFVFILTIIYHYSVTNNIYFIINCITGKKYSKFLLAIYLALVEIALSFLPSIYALSKVSFLSIMLCIAIGFLFLRFSLLKLENLNIQLFEYKGISKSIGFIIFSLTAHIVIPEVFNSLNSSASMFTISVVGVSIGAILSILIGLSGYFFSGSILKKCDNIFLFFNVPNTPFENSYFKFGSDPKCYRIFATIILFIILLIFSYALILFSAKKCLFYTFNRNITMYSNESISYKIGLFCVSLLWIIATTLISTFYYPIKILNISRIYLANIVSFLIPSIAYIYNCGKKNSLLYLISLLVLFFGIISISYSTFDLKTKGN